MNRKKYTILGLSATLLTIIISVFWIFPLYWGLKTSLTPDMKTVAFPPTWIPHPLTFNSFTYVFKNSPILRWYLNSVFTSLVITVVVIILTMFCAYALSQLNFRGKRLLFLFFLAGFMIPGATNVVPLFMFMNRLNLVNTYWGLILPQLAAPITVIIYKRFFDQVPKELSDAMCIDGAGEFRILFRLFLPLNWGVTWALAIVLFTWSWNNFFWPFIILNSTPMLTIPVGITQVQSAYGVQYSETMATAILAALPTAILYIVFHRQVAKGIAVTAGLK